MSSGGPLKTRENLLWNENKLYYEIEKYRIPKNRAERQSSDKGLEHNSMNTQNGCGISVELTLRN
jgi:hypothetical protein